MVRRIGAGLFLLALMLSPSGFCQSGGSNSGGQSGGGQGAKVFSNLCSVCHGPEGKGVIGPSLKGQRDPDWVKKFVEHGMGKMPSFSSKLSSQQIQAVSNYVAHTIGTIHLTGGNLSEGGVLYRVNCSPCHRTAVRGGALALASRNAPSLVGLSPGAISGSIRAGPGPMPNFSSTVFSDHQVASIVAYVRFMQHPEHKGGLPLDYYGPVAEGLAAFFTVIIIAIFSLWIEHRGRG